MEDNHLNDQFQKYRDPRIVEKDPLVDRETSAAFLRRLVEYTHSADFDRAGYVELIKEIVLHTISPKAFPNSIKILSWSEEKKAKVSAILTTEKEPFFFLETVLLRIPVQF